MSSAVLPFIRRRRRRLLLLSATALLSFAAYKLHRHPAVVRRRQALNRLLSALFSLADAASSTASAVSLVASDLKSFLSSDADDLPPALRQISKIAQSDDFSASLSRLSQALTLGVSRGLRSTAGSSDSSDRVVDKVFSPAGTGFASAVAGSFAKGLVLGFHEGRTAGVESNGDELPHWARLVCSEKGREMVGNWIQAFVGTAVSVYLDKTMDINFYDDIFAGLTNPKHQGKMLDTLVSVCNGAMETLVRTSHEVLTSSEGQSSNGNLVVKREAEKRSFDQNGGDRGWMSQVASTLSVPRNRSFVLDVTGRITFETVRSCLEFGLWKMYDGLKRGMNAAQFESVKRGLEVVRYCSAKSQVVVTICIVLCMNVFMRRPVLTAA